MKKTDNKRIIAVIFLLAAAIVIIFFTDLFNTSNEYGGMYEYSHYVKYETLSLDYSNDELIEFSSMIMYKNRYYGELCSVDKNADIIDYHIGSISGNYPVTFDKSKDYVELGGRGRGDVYAVKGYSPKVLLAKRNDVGYLSLYISLDDFVLRRGNELYRDVLNIHKKLKDIEIVNSNGKTKVVSQKEKEIILQVLDNLCSAEILFKRNVKRGSRIGSFNLVMDNGVKFNISIYSEGCAYFYGSRATCQKIDKELFGKLKDLFYSDEDRIEAEKKLNALRGSDVLGRYLPTYIPESTPLYNWSTDDTKYGEGGVGVIGVRAMVAEFTKQNLPNEPYFAISPKERLSFGRLKDFSFKFDVTELSTEKIKEASADDGSGREIYQFTMAWDDYKIVFESRNISAEEVYKILTSINPQIIIDNTEVYINEAEIAESEAKLKELKENMNFGKYVPSAIPEGMPVLSFGTIDDYDKETGEILSTQSIEVQFGTIGEGYEPFFGLSYKYIGSNTGSPVNYVNCDLDDLTVEKIKGGTKGMTDVSGNVNGNMIDITVFVDDVAINFYSYYITPEECYKILSSINP